MKHPASQRASNAALCEYQHLRKMEDLPVPLAPTMRRFSCRKKQFPISVSPQLVGCYFYFTPLWSLKDNASIKTSPLGLTIGTWSKVMLSS